MNGQPAAGANAREPRPLIHELGAFAASTDARRLPAAVVYDIPMRFLDSVGICLAAASRGLADGVVNVALAAGGTGESRLIGHDGAFPAAQAALVNGTLAHSLDFDDTHLPSVLHPSASVIPAALAVGEAVGASGDTIVAAAAVGLEITVRIGMGGYLPDEGNVFFERGWHATSICGTLGAAAAAGRLMGLDAEGIAHAMAIGASMSGGLLESNRAGGTVKRLHCGWAAHAGVNAAQLAAAGFTGPPTVLEGRFGFFHAYLDGHWDREALTNGLGTVWRVPEIFFKPYPANHYTHAAIDAAIALRNRFAIDPAHIRAIRLGAAAAVLRTIGEPREEKLRPRSGYHAQFSGPFAVAAALLGGGGLGVWFDDFTDEKARDPAILKLAAKVETYADPACDELFPNQFPAVLSIEMDDGRRVEERVMTNWGGPGRPLSGDDLLTKFRLNAGLARHHDEVEALATALVDIANAPDLERVLALASGAGERSRG